jgi:hypothetical protein
MKTKRQKGRLFTELTPHEQVTKINQALALRHQNKVSLRLRDIVKVVLATRLIIGKFFVPYDSRYFSLESWRNYRYQDGPPIDDNEMAKLAEAISFFSTRAMTPDKEGLYYKIPKSDQDLHIFAALPELLTKAFGDKAEMRLRLLEAKEISGNASEKKDIARCIPLGKPYYTLREVLVYLIYHQFGVTWFGQIEAYRVIALLSQRIHQI